MGIQSALGMKTDKTGVIRSFFDTIKYTKYSNLVSKYEASGDEETAFQYKCVALKYKTAKEGFGWLGNLIVASGRHYGIEVYIVLILCSVSCIAICIKISKKWRIKKQLLSDNQNFGVEVTQAIDELYQSIGPSDYLEGALQSIRKRVLENRLQSIEYLKNNEISVSEYIVSLLIEVCSRTVDEANSSLKDSSAARSILDLISKNH